MKKNKGSFAFPVIWVGLLVFVVYAVYRNNLSQFFLFIILTIFMFMVPGAIFVLIIRSVVKTNKNNTATSKYNPIVKQTTFTRSDGKVRPHGQNPEDSMFSSLNDYDVQFYKAGRINVVDPWDIKDEKPPWEL